MVWNIYEQRARSLKVQLWMETRFESGHSCAAQDFTLADVAPFASPGNCAVLPDCLDLKYSRMQPVQIW